MSDRLKRKEIAEATLAILKAGAYDHADSRVDLSQAFQQCTAGSTMVEEQPSAPIVMRQADTRIDVVEQSTLSAARALVAQGHSVAALNFASAKNPGGGFLSGAEAQEESLARSSALYAALSVPAVAEHYRLQKSALKGGDGLYTHAIVYSPAVPVFREDSGALIDEPWAVAFVTAAAPNAGVARAHGVSEEEISATLSARAERVLSVAAARNHDALVLGAWGCGVFGNDPRSVAKTFARLLGGKFAGAFARVTFAILGPQSNRSPFVDAFPPARPPFPTLPAACGETAAPSGDASRNGGSSQPRPARERRAERRRVQHGWTSEQGGAAADPADGAASRSSHRNTSALCRATLSGLGLARHHAPAA